MQQHVRLRPVRRAVHGEAAVPQPGRDHVPQVVVVLHQQHTHGEDASESSSGGRDPSF
ncbi:hypothetical protein SPW_7135 [Streptomyces sp. W007]|nr:hypothetical protein SPW_7135 [Streptomyces sp. W007]